MVYNVTKEETMANFGSRLSELRKNKNLTMKDLANEIGVSRTTISRYENDSRQPSKEVLEVLADYFEVTTDYLLGRTNQKYFSQDETIAFHAKGDLNEEDQKMVRDLIDRLVKDHKGTDK